MYCQTLKPECRETKDITTSGMLEQNKLPTISNEIDITYKLIDELNRTYLILAQKIIPITEAIPVKEEENYKEEFAFGERRLLQKIQIINGRLKEIITNINSETNIINL